MITVDPVWLVVLGALVTLLIVLLTGLGFAIALGTWAWNRLSVFDLLTAEREDGKIRLGGELVDLARTAKKKAARPVTNGVARRMTGPGRTTLS